MRHAFLLLTSFMLVSLLPAAINITGFDTLTNDRFAADASFVADGFDLSGVAYNGTGAGGSGWLTMISPNVYITAEHAKPSIGSSATFYASNDPSGASLTREVTSNRLQIGTTDIFVGTLSAPLTGSYANEIQSFIDANPVPEPSQAALLIGLLGLAATLPRRSR